MGLASAMAAAGAGAYMARPGGSQQQPPYPQQGGYPGQQPSYPPPQQAGRPPYPGAAPGGQYQAYSGGQQGQQPGYQQGGYGQPPQQQQYGQPSQAPIRPVQNPSVYTDLFRKALEEKRLNPSMFPRLDLNSIANAAPNLIGQLANEWPVNPELLPDLAVLGLYDIIIFIDNSGSMRFEENGDRIKDLALILNRVAGAATKFDSNGISLRFMNRNQGSPMQLDGIRNAQDIERLVGTNGQGGAVQFTGLTPLGSELRAQVIEPMVQRPLSSRSLEKPVMVIVITDGQPAGESRDTLRNVIHSTLQASERAYGPGARAVSFQIAQVGNDEGARRFLGELDEDSQIGDIVDCTSNYEVESTEYARVAQKQGIQGPMATMSPELWLLKLLLGAVNKEYDFKDETNRPSGGQMGASGGSYGQQPPYQQQGYQQQQSQYNRPPPGPPYPQQGYGAPLQGAYPPQGGYQPQGQGGYPPQGGYGGPPPPPRY